MEMIFPRSVLHHSFVDLAALQKLQWIILPSPSSPVKYYHLHSVRAGKTTEGINDSPRIQQQLCNRRDRSMWRLDHTDSRSLSDRDMFWRPLSLELCKPLSKGSVSLIRSSQSHADGGNFRIFFLDVFLGM